MRKNEIKVVLALKPENAINIQKNLKLLLGR